MQQYKPTPGYFDLTEKPKSMSDTQHKKIQAIQTDLVREAQKYRDPEVRQWNYVAFERLQYYMSELQWTILNNWPRDMLFVREGA